MDQATASCDPTNTSPSTSSEDSFYQMLEPPYFRKNAPLDSLVELRMVRGIGDDFWATFVDPDPNNPKRRPVTVWGQGKINVNSANAQTILAFVCANASPTAPPKMCVDPLESVKFIGVVNLVRTLTSGIPLFGSPKGFIAALKQTNPMIGPILKVMGLDPITFASESEATKAITTESKVFTLNATGYVRSGKRETKVRILSVVDFRSAPPPPNILAALAATGGLSNPGGAGSATPPVTGAPNLGSLQAGLGATGMPPQNLPTGATSDSYASLLVPSPAGRIVYFRVE
jgi:general secretion pathway protein K